MNIEFSQLDQLNSYINVNNTNTDDVSNNINDDDVNNNISDDDVNNNFNDDDVKNQKLVQRFSASVRGTCFRGQKCVFKIL